MKAIQPSRNKHQWARHAVKSVDCRKRDLVFRITNWMSDKDEPAYDVECYVGGVYDWHQSQSFTMHALKTESACKTAAIAFVQAQVTKLL